MANSAAKSAKVLDSWEDLEDIEVLNEQMKGIRIKQRENSRPLTNMPIYDTTITGTQYQAPTNQVKILKRRSDPKTPNADSQSKAPTTTYEERAAKYDEVRKRIMGGAESEPTLHTPPTDSSTDSSTDTNRQVITSSQAPPQPISREPRGPDGSRGFLR